MSLALVFPGCVKHLWFPTSRHAITSLPGLCNLFESVSSPVVSDSLWLHGATRLLCPGIPQAGTLEWVAMSFSRGSSQPRDQTWVSCIAGRIFTIWACREAQNLFEAAAFYRLLLQWNHQLCLQFHLSVSENKMQASIQAWPYKKKTLYSSEYRGLNRGHRLHSKASAKKLNGSSDVTEMNWYAISQGWGWGVLPGQGRRSWCSKNLRVEFSNKSPSLREKCEITETAPRPDGEGGWHPR